MVLDGVEPAVARAFDAALTALRKAGAEVLAVPRALHGTGVDLVRALGVLREREIVSVLLEGGARVAGSFLAERLVDRVVGYLAPVLIGGGGLAVLTGPGASRRDAALRLRLDEVTPIGTDVRLVARPTAWEA